jgi:hypothetical protein
MNQIVITANECGFGRVLLDGKDVSDSVKAIGFNCAPGEPTEVTLVLSADAVIVAATVEKVGVVKERV